ncbi:MAG: SMC-Scp complex subunit ScpB [Acidobacteriota bacterium]|nr:SMC-Scp complex subunit ScpB [Acidobacteriota bacterium]
MSLKAKVEAIIYAAEEPVTLEQIASLLRADVLADLATAKAAAEAEAAETASEPTASAAGEISPELAADEEPAPEAGPLLQFNGEATESAPETQEEAAPEDAAEVEALAAQAEAEPGEAASGEATTEATPETAGDAAASDTAAEVSSEAPAESASVQAPETTSRKRAPKKTEAEIAEDKAVRARLREVLVELIKDFAGEERGIEVRQIAGGFRMATKPEHHDVVRAFAKSLKPPIRLSLAALETLAVVAYKQPITGPEITDIRGVESAGVIGTLLDRKLITTAGRKQVIGRPMQYKTSKEFLLRFGLNEINELPSMEEFSQLASDMAAMEIAPSEPAAPELFPAQDEGSNDGETGANAAPESMENAAAEEDAVQQEATPATAAPENAAESEAAAPEATSADVAQSETELAPEQEPAGHE